jgi:hypothetical protein
MLENGVPLWAVISLTPDGDGMRMAQMSPLDVAA